MSRPLCDGFYDSGGEEYLIEVFGTDDGYVDEYQVSTLLDDGRKMAYEPKSPEEYEKFQAAAQSIYAGFCDDFI